MLRRGAPARWSRKNASWNHRRRTNDAKRIRPTRVKNIARALKVEVSDEIFAMKFLVIPSSGLRGKIKVAGDKSISHRAVIFGAIANGVTRVSGLLEGEDVLATMAAFRAMGINITRASSQPDDNHYEIQGNGLHGLAQPDSSLDLGNSGTALRLLTGLLCAQPWSTTLTGDDSLRRRPMGRIIDPLTRMGVHIESADGKPPLHIAAAPRANPLRGIHYATPMASAQVKSAILLAGLYAEGRTSVTETAPTRDHTERMLAGFGYAVEIQQRTVSVSGGGTLLARAIAVPADLSSAAFFILAALITKNSELVLQRVGVNPSRAGVLTILQRMGGDIELIDAVTIGGEPVADIVVRSSELRGCDVGGDDVALAIDEIPVIAVAAACATGLTRISEAAELRVKESDRIHCLVNGLKTLGINVKENVDGMVIEGGKLTGGRVQSCGDHRIAMAFSIAGAAALEPVEVLDCDNVATSFPDFQPLAHQAGINIAVN